MFNWQIIIGTPQITQGMSFKVRYKEMPSGEWINFLPNPTQNTILIPNLEEGIYRAEIRTVCANGTISTPRVVETSCGGGGLPPTISILWNDTQDTAIKNCPSACGFGVDYQINEQGTNIVLLEAEISLDGNVWTDHGVVNNQNYQVANSQSFYIRYKATDDANNVAYSNILQVNVEANVGINPTIISSTPVAAPCGSTDGDSRSLIIQGEPNQVVKFNLKVIQTSGGGGEASVYDNNVNVALVQTLNLNESMDGYITLNSQGQKQIRFDVCLALQLPEATEIVARVRLELYNADYTTLSGQYVTIYKTKQVTQGGFG